MTPSSSPFCQETSGFLFSHPCGRPASFTCVRCGKRICAQHMRPSPPEAFLCISCARTQDTDSGSTDHDDENGGDPYFYADDYRSRSDFAETGDAMDFQEGDRSALGEDEGGAWEDDTGGS
jgi:hypothetical protein